MRAASLCFILALASPADAVARQARFVPLDDLPGGLAFSEATGVSADGQVIVGSSSSSALGRAFRWTESDGMVDLGELPGGAWGSSASAVSHDGAVVVGHSCDMAGSEAFLWTAAAGMIGLGHLPGGGFGSGASGASADGAVIVGAAWSSAPAPVAFRWTAATGMIALGTLPGGGLDSSAHGVDATGSVIVGSGNGLSGTEAFRWTATGVMVGLGDLPGCMFRTPVTGMLLLADHLEALGATGLDGWPPPRWSTRPGSLTCRRPLSPSVIGTARTPVSANDVTLIVEQLPPGRFGYLLAGRTQGFFHPPGSQGILCLSDNIGRYNRAAHIIQGPTGNLRIDLTSVPVHPPRAVLPGETWSFQCWFRDASPGPTSNFTDGVGVLFN